MAVSVSVELGFVLVRVRSGLGWLRLPVGLFLGSLTWLTGLE